MWALAALTLVAARWIDPPTTAVHAERRLQAWVHHAKYQERYEFVSLRQISPEFQHAVIAAEDGQFYQHHGFDWHAMEIAAEGDMEGAKLRGGSTITQQLVKNLFFGTGRSILRKGAEFTLVPVAEFVLGKQRILELYLNVVEWGPGVYGAEAASRYWYQAGAEYRSGARGAAGGDFAVAAEATAGAHGAVQRIDFGADAASGVVERCGEGASHPEKNAGKMPALPEAPVSSEAVATWRRVCPSGVRVPVGSGRGSAR